METAGAGGTRRYELGRQTVRIPVRTMSHLGQSGEIIRSEIGGATWTGDVQLVLNLDHPKIKEMVRRALCSDGGKAIEAGGALAVKALNKTRVVGT